MRSIGRNKAEDRRGSALVFALVTVTLVAGLSYSLLKITHFVGQRQASASDDKRAFYLAEAGLAEAYFGLSRGYTGDLGAPDAPVRIGDGLVWVEATDGADDLVSLRSTGLCGSGRSTVEITVERVEVKLGIFADEGIDLDVPFLIDGYDSDEAPYHEQVSDGVLIVDTLDPYIHVDSENYILFYQGVFYRFSSVYKDANTSFREVTYDAVFDPLAHPDWAEKFDIDWDDFVDHAPGGVSSDYTDIEYEGVLAYFASLDATQTQLFDSGTSFVSMDSDAAALGTSEPFMSESSAFSPTVSSFGPTTGIGGVLSSNGDIALALLDGTVELFGDVMHGTEGKVVLDNVLVTGKSGALPEQIELDPVELPDVEMLPGFVHDSVVPRVIPPGDIGYESVFVQGDSELVILGPGNVVFGDLELSEGSRLSVENLDGKVDVFVTGHVGFDVGSRVTIASEHPADLTLQVAGSDQLDLYASTHFRGGIYAPDSHIDIGKDFELFGFLISNTLSLEPGTRLHFDKGMDSGELLPRLIGWKIEEIPARVRQNRGDPFRIFYGEEHQDVQDVADAMLTECWTMKVTDWGDTDKTILEGVFEGPASAFTKGGKEVKWSEIADIEPPTIGETSWYVDVEYHVTSDPKDMTGYTGPFEDLSGFGGHIHAFTVWEQ